MIDYKLVSRDGSAVIYEYTIEGDPNDGGRVSVDTDSGGGAMLDHEQSVHHKLYAQRLISHLKGLLRSGQLPESGTHMWY